MMITTTTFCGYTIAFDKSNFDNKNDDDKIREAR